MNTNYDDEATQYQASGNEDTQYEETSSTGQANENAASNDEVEVTATKSSGWKRTAVSAGSGLLIGGVATFLMGMKKPDPEPTIDKPVNNHKDELSNPEWVDDNIQVATCVNDDMSFGEAFAAARAEIGPGGCFEWHGNVYGTYTVDEWNHMTEEQRAEWSDHFSWNHIDHSSSNVVQHSTTAQHSTNTQHSTTDQHFTTDHTNHTAETQTATTSDDDIEVVSVNHDNNQNHVTQHTNQTAQSGGQTETVDVSHVGGQSGEAEVEILGVVHDGETGTNIGGMMIDNQEVIFIDIDNDLTFDYMASDLNHNGEVDQNELVDIQDQNITVNDLGGLNNPTGDIMASNDVPDYSSDIYEG